MKKLFALFLLVLGLTQCAEVDQVTEKEQPPAPLYNYDVEERITSMNIELKEPPAPVANYVNAVRSGNLIFMAGKGPSRPEGGYISGKIGVDLTQEEGYKAARLAGIAQLSALKAEIGDLNKVKRIVKVLGMVNCTPDYGNQPEVINGFSDLMVEVFGERGKHARAAVGMGSLPRNIAVEVEMIVEVVD
jgi:enamine deaminase RidA (YjgF/YER057c/UK114 family)